MERVCRTGMDPGDMVKGLIKPQTQERWRDRFGNELSVMVYIQC